MKASCKSIACLGAVLTALVFGPVRAQDGDIEEEGAAARALIEEIDREPARCITVSQIRSTRAIDDQTMLFYMGGNRVFLNVLTYSCRGLERENRISYSTHANQLCSTDTITVLRRFGGRLEQGISCGLGQFVQISREDADFLRYGERGTLMEEEVVELPAEPAESYETDNYGVDEYNNETDYNFEC